MDNCHPPSHEFELNSLDDRVVAIIEHYPLNSDAVTDVGEGAAITDVMILFYSKKEGFGFADVGIEEFFIWETESATKATREKPESVDCDVE